jgi:hypothetical protein
MLDEHEGRIRAWIDAEPTLSAQAVLARLIAAAPAQFAENHLRTLQRAVKAWRGEIARNLVRDGALTLTAAPVVPVAAE